jgi:hypothetical protein
MRPAPDVGTLARGGCLLELARRIFRVLDRDLDAVLLGEVVTDLLQAVVALVAVDPDQQPACLGLDRACEGERRCHGRGTGELAECD